ncbi:MAG: 4-hydroxythreonine-4-phosphate dehydrogenase PdxA [Bacteroidota bacterium]
MSDSTPPVLAVTLGDPNGIGPEITLKTISQLDLNRSTPVLLGAPAIYQYYLQRSNLNLQLHSIGSEKEIQTGTFNVLDPAGTEFELQPGNLTRQAGKWAMRSVEKAIHLCLSGKAQAMITAPISKEAVNKAGYAIPGHTEFLAEKTNTTEYMMMLVQGKLRVALSTIHVPLKEVPRLITEANLVRQFRILHQSLQRDFNIDQPEIAVLGLNPHAGDGGYIGTEELEIIAPALQKARLNDIHVHGPFPADGFFGKKSYQEFDAVLAMYHDQGLVAFKALSFGKGVNFTAGLPIIRTSPDHGTAFDIAGKNIADPGSMQAAYRLAEELAYNRTAKSTAKS